MKSVANKQFLDLCAKQNLTLGSNYFDILYGTAEKLQPLIENGNEMAFLIGLSGSQGSGKSTFSVLLADVLVTFGYTVLVLSLDDFYLTRAQRVSLADNIHPLLKTRGVPGTHDIELLSSVLDQVRQGISTEIPVFNKAEDDRTGSTVFQPGPSQVVLLEGWCWGVKAATESSLDTPINALEREQDPNGIWVKFVNNQIGQYQRVFKTDYSIFLAVPGMQAVLDWRWQQEQRLKKGSQIMSREDIRRFVMCYERITLRMLQEMPSQVDLTLRLDENHHFLP